MAKRTVVLQPGLCKGIQKSIHGIAWFQGVGYHTGSSIQSGSLPAFLSYRVYMPQKSDDPHKAKQSPSKEEYLPLPPIVCKIGRTWDERPTFLRRINSALTRLRRRAAEVFAKR